MPNSNETLINHLHGVNLFKLGMSQASLTRRLATVTNRAVAQFAAEKNEATHDRQWGKSIAPHPDKEVNQLHALSTLPHAVMTVLV